MAQSHLELFPLKPLSKLYDWVLNKSLLASQDFFAYFKGKKFHRKKIRRIKL